MKGQAPPAKAEAGCWCSVLLQAQRERWYRQRTDHFSPLSGVPDAPEHYHTVTIELSAEGEHTLVTLSQDKNATEEERTHAEASWATMLTSLKQFVERP